MPASPKSRRRRHSSSRSRSRSPRRERRMPSRERERKREISKKSRSPSPIRRRKEVRDFDDRKRRSPVESKSPKSRRRNEPVREETNNPSRRRSVPPADIIPESEQNYGKPLPPAEDPNKVKPNFGLSGKLLEDTNTVNGVVITYAQPPEARKPKVRWRLYPFKGDESLPTMFIHRQSAYLLGRDRRIVDIPVDHPSCSKQHAVIQYRMLPTEKEDGTVVRRVRPYIIDLASANGTYVNKKRIEAQRYVELLEKDVLTFGFSSREYVMLHEGSKDDEYKSGEESAGEGD